MPNLNEFISEFKHGFQKANRFRVQIFVQPTMVLSIIREASVLGLVDAALSVPQTIKWLATGFLADNARLPDRGFSLITNTMYGLTENFPYHAEMTRMECTFMMPHTSNILKDNGVPRFFTFWQNQIQNMSDGAASGLDFRFPSHYYATVLLTLLDPQDNGTITYQFDNAYPSLISSVPIGWDHDGFIRLPVTFTFSYWKVLSHLESVGLTALDAIGNVINRIL
jgi:hypothetical protein